MTEHGHPDALNTQAPHWRRRIARGLGIGALIAGGIVAGAKLGQPVKTVEQHVTAPIREAVKRASPLEQLPDSAAAACPAIVSLRVPGLDGPAPQGIVINADGQIVTSAVLPAAATFDAWLDGRKLSATMQAHDPLTGLSVLKLDGADLPALPLGDPDIASPGTWGFILSSPNGSGCIVEPATVASDFITDGVPDDYYLRVHGPGDPPPDGTPFLAADGRVVALAQAGIGKGGRRDRYLPADLIALVVSRLVRTGEAPDPPFGLIAEDLSPILAARLGADRGRGAVVVLIAEGSLAATAGLQIGDVILSAANRPISSSSELARLLGGADPIALTVSRGREKTQLIFTLTPPKNS